MAALSGGGGALSFARLRPVISATAAIDGWSDVAAAAPPARVKAFLVKLTDSSLKSLRALRQRGDGARHQLQLDLDQQQLIFGADQFRFSVSEPRRDGGGGGGSQTQGCQEIVASATVGQAGEQFSHWGPVNDRLTVLATTDSYEDTRQKALQLQVPELTYLCSVKSFRLLIFSKHKEGQPRQTTPIFFGGGGADFTWG